MRADGSAAPSMPWFFLHFVSWVAELYVWCRLLLLNRFVRRSVSLESVGVEVRNGGKL